MDKQTLVSTVLAAQNGDGKALDALFNTFYNDVYYFALKTVKDSELACDITQETFVMVIQRLEDLKEPAAFVTWMKQIAFSQCTRYFRKKKELLADEDEEGNTIFDTLVEDKTEFIPDDKLDQEDFRQTILSMIDQLSEEQRAATLLYYYDELSVREIAQIQGVSEGTVKSRLNYARKAIKSSVEDYEKKSGVKLHSVALLPMLYWLFAGAKKEMPKKAAKKAALAVSKAAGTSVSVAGAASVGIGAKIVAGVVAVSVVAGGAGIGISKLAPKEKEPAPAVVQTDSERTLTVEGTVPEEGQYIASDGTVYEAGAELPAPNARDQYITKDYIYTMEGFMEPTGWALEVTDETKESYERICSMINGYPVVNLNDAFWYCEQMVTAPEIPDTVTSMRGAFCGCRSLKVAPELPDGVTDLFQTFSDCQVLEEPPVIPDSVITMHGTFSDCISLRVAPEIPAGVIDFTSAFGGCRALEEAPVLPDGLLYMGHCFAYCSSLKYPPVLPDGVEDISYAFFYCTALLEKPEIPDSVTNQSHAFQFCDSLPEE